MTDIKTIFSTEVKQPKLGVVWWQNEHREEECGLQLPYDKAEDVAVALNKLFTGTDNETAVHHWVEAVIQGDET